LSCLHAVETKLALIRRSTRFLSLVRLYRPFCTGVFPGGDSAFSGMLQNVKIEIAAPTIMHQPAGELIQDGLLAFQSPCFLQEQLPCATCRMQDIYPLATHRR